MNKKGIISVCCLFGLLVVLQVLNICIHQGNLVFSIWNETQKKGDIEIFIDGEKITTLEKDSGVYYYYSTFVSPKNHILELKFNGYKSQKIKFNTFLFTIICVDLQRDRENTPNDVIRFRINITKSPFFGTA